MAEDVIAKARQALHCLFVEVPKEVAEGVQERVEIALQQVELAREVGEDLPTILTLAKQAFINIPGPYLQGTANLTDEEFVRLEKKVAKLCTQK